MRSSYNEASGRIDENVCIRIYKLFGNYKSDNLAFDLAAKNIEIRRCRMLSGNHHGIDAHRYAVIVFYRNLSLSVGIQISHDTVFSHFGKTFGQTVRKIDRHRHQRLRLVAGITEHHTLVAGADIICGGIAVLGFI